MVASQQGGERTSAANAGFKAAEGCPDDVGEDDGVVGEGNGEIVQASKLKYRVFIPGLSLQPSHRGLCRSKGEGQYWVILGPGLGKCHGENVFREDSSLEIAVHQRVIASKIEDRLVLIKQLGCGELLVNCKTILER